MYPNALAYVSRVSMGRTAAARAVLGTMHSPRSGGGPVGYGRRGNRRDWFPGARGRCMVPSIAKTGGGR
jgi:hypothetical protein